MGQYTVRPGDNLTKIARNLSNVTGPGTYGYVQALITINKIKDPNKIYPGQVLQYPDEWFQPTAGRKPMTIAIQKGYDEPTYTGAEILPPARGGIFKPGQPIWKNPIVLGAVAVLALLLLTKKG